MKLSILWPLARLLHHFVLFALFAFGGLAKAQLHDAPPLRNALDGTLVGADTKKVVILIHGWMSKDADDLPSGYDAYQDLKGRPALAYLFFSLKQKLSGSGWKFAPYHWEVDAATGSLDRGDGNFFYGAAVQSAQNAAAHGPKLATMLNDAAPELREVHFIAHSAGSWVAREAMRVLLQSNPYVVIQMTLLDPFIPDASLDYDTGLSTSKMGATDSLAAVDRIHRMENYYADELPFWNPFEYPFPTSSTQEEFSWRSGIDINQQVDHGLLPPAPFTVYYDYHSGPLEFYADTVKATMPGEVFPNGLVQLSPQFDFLSVGYYKSRQYESFQLPRIVAQPQDTSVKPGYTATLAVTTNRGTSWEWYKGGVLKGSGATLILSNVSSADEGDYVVRVSNSYGLLFSDKAHVTVTQDPPPTTPTISSVTPYAPDATGVAQLFTITGSNFASDATVTLHSWNQDFPNRTVSSRTGTTQIVINPNFGTAADVWSVEVFNGTVSSGRFSFHVHVPPATPATRSLSVASWNSSSVGIAVTLADNSGQTGGATPFNRTYNTGAQVTLTAPATADGNSFQKWQMEGVDAGTNTSLQVTMGANRSATAIYTGSIPTLPNLTSYKPSTWSDSLIVATTANDFLGATTIYDDQDIYVNHSSRNVSAVAITQTYTAKLFVDGVVRSSGTFSGLPARNYINCSNWFIGKLSAGSHTIRVEHDSNGEVVESNEIDNTQSRTIVVLVRPVSKPSISSTLLASGTQYQSFTYQITAANFPTLYDADGLPPGLDLNPTTGVISGTPSLDGIFTIRLAAGNAEGTDEKTLTLSLAVGTPPTPVGFKAIAVTKNAAAFAWKDSSNGQAYSIIERMAGSTGAYSSIAVLSRGTTSWVDAVGLTSSATYSYRIRSWNGATRYSAYSTDASIITQTEVPPWAQRTVATGASNYWAIAADASHIYWSSLSSEGTSLLKAGKDDGSVLILASGLANNVFAIDVFGDFVYWAESNGTTGNGGIKMVSKSGGLITTVSISNSMGAGNGIRGLHVDSSGIYWVEAGQSNSGNFGSVKRVGGVAVDNPSALAGVAPVTLVPNLANPTALACDEGFVYWIEHNWTIANSGAVRRIAKSGGPIGIVASGFGEVKGLVVDSTSAFFGEWNGGVHRVSKEGGSVTSIGGYTSSQYLALDDAYVYYTSFWGSSLGRVPKVGGSRQTVATGLTSPWGIAADSTGVCWTEQPTTFPPNGTLRFVPNVVTYVVTPSAGPNGGIDASTPQIVIDGGSVSFNATPTNGFTVGEWIVNGSVFQTGGNSITLYGVNGNKTVRVTFIAEEQPGTLAFALSNSQCGEAAGTHTITVNRTGGSRGAVSVNYDVSFSGIVRLASSPEDFSFSAGTLDFAAHETSKTFTAGIIQDGELEGSEVFTVFLSSPSGGASLGANMTHTVTIADDDVLTPNAAGYSGLLKGDVGTEGYGSITLKKTATGALTGRVLVNGRTFSFTGSLSQTGSYTKTFKYTVGALVVRPVLTVQIQNDGTFSGSWNTGNGSSHLITGEKNGTGTVVQPIAQAGRYTALLRGENIEPGGGAVRGYLRATVAANGVTTFAGALPDGRKLSGSSRVSIYGNLSVIFGLYQASSGYLFGPAAITGTGAERVFAGDLAWFKPPQTKGIYASGLHPTRIQLAGHVWTKPATGARLVTDFDLIGGEMLVTLSAGELNATISKVVILTTKNNVAIAPRTAERLALTVMPGTGFFTGTFRHSDGITRTFNGVFVQDHTGASTIEGYFPGVTVPGLVTITIPPP